MTLAVYYYLGVLLKIAGLHADVWLGGSDEANEGTWEWTDQSPGTICTL